MSSKIKLYFLRDDSFTIGTGRFLCMYLILIPIPSERDHVAVPIERFSRVYPHGVSFREQQIQCGQAVGFTRNFSMKGV
jgi:hypothetical protein